GQDGVGTETVCRRNGDRGVAVDARESGAARLAAARRVLPDPQGAAEGLHYIYRSFPRPPLGPREGVVVHHPEVVRLVPSGVAVGGPAHHRYRFLRSCVVADRTVHWVIMDER